jgi:hypothetical protein
MSSIEFALVPTSWASCLRERDKRVSSRAWLRTCSSPISRHAAPAGLRPRLPISAELRFGMNSGAASGADGAARRRLPIASLVPASKRPALSLS